MNVQNSIEEKPDKAIGCGLELLVTLGFIWVILLSGLNLFLTWVTEQTIIEAGRLIPDFRWIIQLVCSVLMLAVCLAFAWLAKDARVKRIFKLWFFAAILALLTIPTKAVWISNQNLTAILQGTALIIVIGVSNLFTKNKNYLEDKAGKFSISGIVVIVCTLFFTPWLLWGALGSWLDTLLEVVTGILFAWFAVKYIFQEYVLKIQDDIRNMKFTSILFDGLVIFVFLLISIAALAVNGSQQMLVLTVPVAGWMISILASIWIKDKARGRLSAGIIIGLLFSLPLVFFDMDELTTVFTGGVGETLEWATKAAWYTFWIVLFVTLVLLTSLKIIRKITIPKVMNMSFIALGLASILIVYLGWGQVGFFGDKQFLILKAQADLSGAEEIQDYVNRRSWVYEELVKTAETTQFDLRTRLDDFSIKYNPYYLVNGIEINGGLFAKLILQNDPSIDRILDNPQLRPLPKVLKAGEGEMNSLPEETLWNISMIHADQVVNELGVTGVGIVVGQTDSGVDGLHPELAKAYRGISNNDDFNWYDPWNNTSSPTDISGHGTQTLGIILGEHTGVAPGAQWIGCVNLARNQGNPAVYLDCMQFMLAPYPQESDAFRDGEAANGAMIVNNSWGCPMAEGCDENVFLSAVDALKAAGVFMSVAAGNSGDYGCGTVMDPPAIYADVLSAGSVNQNGDISSFSSLDSYAVDEPALQKPEILAPGEGVTSAYPGGGYSTASGTSFAAPHVSGVVALMWSANPKLIGNIDQTTKILLETSHDYQGQLPSCVAELDQIESGLLDAYQAVKQAIVWQP